MQNAEEEGSRFSLISDTMCLGITARPTGARFFDSGSTAMPNPKINPVILVSPVENGYVAYDPVLDRLHHLNPAAALIAELSDGSRSIDNICALICPLVAEMQPEDASNWIVKSIDA